MATKDLIIKELETQADKIIIVGAGLVGILSSIYFANLGLTVEVYERNQDIRKGSHNSVKKSINLALSKRGITALKVAGIDINNFLSKYVIPMRGRFLHDEKGNYIIHPYGLKDQAINSVDRTLFNKVLLDEAEKLSNITIYFEHKLVECDLDQRRCLFENNNIKKEIFGSLIVGADGSYSKVRSDMIKTIKVNFHQEYIDHGYVELTIPPNINKDGIKDYKIPPNYMHLWPRKTYMMIASPNTDYSFTCTLFMPFSEFDKIRTQEDLIDFFEKSMPDSLPLIGKDNLIKDYFENPKSSLICTKISPLNYGSKAVIIGDAAHSMVPFYGQGMNAGFEDVYQLFKIYKLEEAIENKRINSHKLELILNEYSRKRYLDAVAICDLAMKNYIEMRSTVYSLSYRIKKHLGLAVHYLFPRLFIPLYSMISFSNIPYSKTINKNRIQNRILDGIIFTSSSMMMVIIYLFFKKYKSIKSVYKLLMNIMRA